MTDETNLLPSIIDEINVEEPHGQDNQPWTPLPAQKFKHMNGELVPLQSTFSKKQRTPMPHCGHGKHESLSKVYEEVSLEAQRVTPSITTFIRVTWKTIESFYNNSLLHLTSIASQTAHEGFPVGCDLQEASIGDGLCPMCRSEEETVLHALQDYLYAYELLTLAGFQVSLLSTQFNSPLKWLEVVIYALDSKGLVGFIVLLWNIWNRRNLKVHGDGTQPPWLIVHNARLAAISIVARDLAGLPLSGMVLYTPSCIEAGLSEIHAITTTKLFYNGFFSGVLRAQEEGLKEICGLLEQHILPSSLADKSHIWQQLQHYSQFPDFNNYLVFILARVEVCYLRLFPHRPAYINFLFRLFFVFPKELDYEIRMALFVHTDNGASGTRSEKLTGKTNGSWDKKRWSRVPSLPSYVPFGQVKSVFVELKERFQSHSMNSYRIYEFCMNDSPSFFFGMEQLQQFPHLQQWLKLSVAGSVELGHIVESPIIRTTTSVVPLGWNGIPGEKNTYQLKVDITGFRLHLCTLVHARISTFCGGSSENAAIDLTFYDVCFKNTRIDLDLLRRFLFSNAANFSGACMVGASCSVFTIVASAFSGV
ncbi:hypothetical protein F3Y22_tig00116989pilonHSYRG00454 [Hibiscus syriacus]|uniref:Uncharacterized protein n=1 Tax=Hibiscus syriacus TaxID=106335 RepID=A0A6A2X6F9_HIBSY|nr:hypothetical protein F3Y22_tig00116989pilonHSYRG00454 [Hibiscus syriacus]